MHIHLLILTCRWMAYPDSVAGSTNIHRLKFKKVTCQPVAIKTVIRVISLLHHTPHLALPRSLGGAVQ